MRGIARSVAGIRVLFRETLTGTQFTASCSRYPRSCELCPRVAISMSRADAYHSQPAIAPQDSATGQCNRTVPQDSATGQCHRTVQPKRRPSQSIRSHAGGHEDELYSKHAPHDIESSNESPFSDQHCCSHRRFCRYAWEPQPYPVAVAPT